MGKLAGTCFLCLAAYSQSGMAATDEVSIVEELCSESMPKTEAECHEYLGSLQEKQERSIEESMALAVGYLILEEGAQWRGESDTLLSLAESYYLEVLDKDPKNAPALYGLTILADPSDEFSMLRALLSEHPSYEPALNHMSRRITWLDDKAQQEEAISIVETGYELSEGNEKWVTAGYLYRALRRVGDDSKTKRFRERVLHDMGIINITDERVDVEENMRRACTYYAMMLDSAEICFRTLVDLQAARDLASSSSSLLGNVSEAMSNLLPFRHELTGTEPDALLILRDISEDLLEGFDDEESAQHLLVHSVLTTGERELEVLRKASEIDSEHRGQALYWLGEALSAAGKNDEALEAYRLALKSNVEPYAGLAQAAHKRLEVALTNR